MIIGDVELHPEDLSTHIRIMGPSGMGKSTLLYDILTQLVMEDASFALLDPHGELYGQILAFLAYLDKRENVSLLDATRRDITATVNPFTSLPAADAIETKAQVLVDLTLKVWGKESEAVRADKILYILYIALLEQGRPLSDLLRLLENPGPIRDQFARSEWERIKGKSYLDAVTTRLKPLMHSRLLALTDPRQALDFSKVHILLANLSHSGIMGEVECKTLFAFLVAEIWAAAFTRQKRFPPFYLVIDELTILATEEIASVLTQAQKFGLHLIILHQDEGQLSKHLKGALGNVSCFIQFIRRGEVVVTGWGSGVNETYLDPEPVPFVSDEVIERYRNKVAIVPKPVIQKPPPPQPTAAIVPESVTPRPQPSQPHVEAKGGIPLGGPLHRETQERIKKVAEAKGFKSDIEKAIDHGKGFVDVSLEKDGLRIACEVSITTSATWEAKNILKCVQAGYDHVAVVCSQPDTIPALTAKIKMVVPVVEQHKIKVMTLDAFFRFLTQIAAPVNPNLGKPGKLAGSLLDLKEAAEFFDVSTSTVYRWARDGSIPFVRVGRNYRFERDVLITLGRHDLFGKRRASVNLEPVKIEKPKSRTKKQQDSRYRKMLKLD